MTELPDLNITALAAGKGYQGKEQGRYARSKRGMAVPTSFDNTKLLWYVSDISASTDLADMAARVSAGILNVSQWESIQIDGSWTSARVTHRVDIAAQEFTTVVNNEKLWLKVEFAQLGGGSSYRAQFQAVDDSIPDTLNIETFSGDVGPADPPSVDLPEHTHSMDHSHTITLKAGGANELAAQLLTDAKQYDGYVYEKLAGSTVPTDTDDHCYFHIATFRVATDSGVSTMTIEQHILGCPIAIPLLATTYGDGIGD